MTLTELIEHGVVEGRCWTQDKTGTFFIKDPQWMPCEIWDKKGLPAKVGAHLITGWDIRDSILMDGEFGAVLQVHPNLWYDLRAVSDAEINWEMIELN